MEFLLNSWYDDLGYLFSKSNLIFRNNFGSMWAEAKFRFWIVLKYFNL